MIMNDQNSDLIRFLNSSVSPYHTVYEAEKRLRDAGFRCLDMTGDWDIVKGENYYTRMFDTGLLAFHAGDPLGGLRLSAAHTDWPGLRVRPKPEMTSAGCCRLSVEVYGGAILSSWFDRPLSVAGIVTLQGSDVLKPDIRLIDFSQPVLVIPNLAIHMNRDANKGTEINAAKDILPLCRTIEDGWEKENYLISQLAAILNVEPSEILSYDLLVYNPQEAQIAGFEEDMLLSPRLDNLTSVYACLDGILRADSRTFCGIVLYDNEEIGSGTREGAGSRVLASLLEKAMVSLGYNAVQCRDSFMKGLLLSCDVAHALHPNYTEKGDNISFSLLNRGVALKLNASRRYATDAAGWAIVESLCRNAGIPLQRYANRADMAGGGTIGSIASAMTGIRAVDVGVPILAMHASSELMGIKDQDSLDRLVRAFFEA